MVTCFVAEFSDISDNDFCFSEPLMELEPPKKNPGPETLPGGGVRDFFTALVIQK
jgi:hypothetical protein